MLWPAVFVLIFGIAAIGYDQIAEWMVDRLFNDKEPELLSVLGYGMSVLFWIAFAWFHCRAIDVFFWQAVVQRRTGMPPPHLLIDVVRVVIFILFGMIILRVVFDRPLTGLLVSSGVITIVLGFALQRMISDFFSGIALNVERPFHIGDWIKVNDVAGEVIEINWRATRIVTLEHVMVIIPNADIAGKHFFNYDEPDKAFRTEFTVSIEYAVQVRDAKRVLYAAILATEGVLADPKPDVLVGSFGNHGVEYRVRFFLSSYRDINVVTDRVATNVSEHLWQAGMNIPYPKQDVFYAPMGKQIVDRNTERSILLSRCSLFQALTKEELEKLGDFTQPKVVPAGAAVIKQGEAGDSLFVVIDGLFDVIVKTDHREKKVAQIVPGQYFGEMSLLTGAPRSATIVATSKSTVYEITKPMLAPILEARPSIALSLSQVVAERKIRTDASLKATDTKSASTAERNLTDELVQKIRSFFGLYD